MKAKSIMKRLSLTLLTASSLLAVSLAYRLWDNSRTRVQSAQRAVEMAKAAAGPRVSNLSMRVETEQDFWTVRFGPDDKGRVHSYLVSIWDKRARPVVEQTVTVDLRRD